MGKNMKKMVIEENKNILIVSPHPDDESIGCGGLLKLYGKQADILLLTDGRKGGCTYCHDESALVQLRKEEFLSAAQYADARHTFLLEIPEGTLRNSYQTIKKFDFSMYDYIFVPNKYESHHDHADTFNMVKKCIKKNKQKLFQYEVWTPLRYPTHYLDITSVMNHKEIMIGKYKSQTESVDYPGRTKGLNRYRAIRNTQDDTASGYAEAYELTASFFHHIGSLIYHELPYYLKALLEKVSICKNEHRR